MLDKLKQSVSGEHLTKMYSVGFSIIFDSKKNANSHRYV